MKARDLVVLFALAALWGSSFLFIRVAVPSFGPVALVGARLLLGALLLWVNSFIVYSDGPNHEFRAFETGDSYWEYLQYRIDGTAADDSTVGIRGRLKFTVVLENNRLAASNPVREI